MWILGNEKTLTSSENVWKSLVLNDKYRQRFFNVDEDEDLAKAILNVKKELDQFDDLLNADSVLFRNARWKVYRLESLWFYFLLLMFISIYYLMYII